MEERKTSRDLLLRWLDGVMADKVFFSAVINGRIAKDIGLGDNTLDNIIRIIKSAAKELCGQEISSGRISNILIEKKKGLWEMIVFKERKKRDEAGPL